MFSCRFGVVIRCEPKVLFGAGIGTGLLAITATPDVALGNPFLGGGGARNIQIGLKFTF